MTATVKSKDLTEGPLFSRIFLYSLPMMLTGILQLLYNAADTVVVGRFSADSTTSIAAVGSTGSLTNLILNLILGLSAGTSVVVAQAYGAKNKRDVDNAVHTSMAISLVGGIFFAAIGFFGARYFLGLMDSPDDVIGKATLYMKICFLGVPASVIYNFGSSIVRATGDTKRPLIILSSAGVINVLLNLFFVIVFEMDVAGVALATIISQYVSAIAILCILIRTDDCIRFNPKRLRIEKGMALKIMRVGLPSGIQGCMFSISNVLIQSAVNVFPNEVIAGNTVGSNLEGFTYTVMNSFHHATLAFSGQNYGAKKYHRLNRILLYSLIQVTAVGLIFGFGELALGRQLASIYDENAAIIDAAVYRMQMILPGYFMCGIMEVLVGQLRGMGNSFVPMLSSVFGACIFRSAWILTVFASNKTQFVLYVSYPISWFITIILHTVTLVVVYKRLKRSSARDNVTPGLA